MSGKGGGGSSNGSKEPDWAKFGLNSEKQPLNSGQPGTGTSGQQSYGGQQSTNDNELFNEDQVKNKSIIHLNFVVILCLLL